MIKVTEIEQNPKREESLSNVPDEEKILVGIYKERIYGIQMDNGSVWKLTKAEMAKEKIKAKERADTALKEKPKKPSLPDSLFDEGTGDLQSNIPEEPDKTISEPEPKLTEKPEPIKENESEYKGYIINEIAHDKWLAKKKKIEDKWARWDDNYKYQLENSEKIEAYKYWESCDKREKYYKALGAMLTEAEGKVQSRLSGLLSAKTKELPSVEEK